MPLVAGLKPNIRQADPNEAQLPSAGVSFEVHTPDPNGDKIEYDAKGNILSIEHPDGSITISLDGKPLGESKEKKDNDYWFRNLVEDIDQMELGKISNDLMRGIANDLSSRAKWIDDRSQGLKLLGLSIELPNSSSAAADGAPLEGMSKVRHPLLLEAVLRFQANARSELLPTDGPMKIRNDNNNSDLPIDQLANALEKDMNHYLTSTAKEYYPDTDRMLLMLGFSGTAFKKVYFCPLRNRPVSETVDANDLIVNDAATDLTNARRVTHRVVMKPSVVKRLQILGVYRDVSLSDPVSAALDAIQTEKNSIQGINPETADPEDRNREIYECYCELDIKGFEHKNKGKETGLEIPYRVTIDTSTKEILSIVRNYNEDTKDLPEMRQSFVKYTFVPGFGFYDIGLLHILGNTTNAITAAWRELLDSGMFASFPGFLMADTGARQNTNIFRVPPGGAALVKTGNRPISEAIMPLPYKEPSPALMQLVQDMAQTGMRIGGTSEAQVGEGRADAPVGTTLAMIDQATKVMNSVHKRMHAAQAEEFQLLVDCFRENPESFWQRNKKPARKWDAETFERAVNSCDLVPQADPNTASHSQRVMKIMALKQLQAQNPSLYDPIAIDVASLQAIGWSNPEQFMVPTDSLGQDSPEIQKGKAELAIKKQLADSNQKLDDARVAELQAKAKHLLTEQPKAGLVPKEEPKDTHVDFMDAQAKLVSAEAKHRDVDMKAHLAAIEDENRDKDRQSRERVQLLQIAKDLMLHPENAAIAEPLMKPTEKNLGMKEGQ
jgi:hypothetical protein